MSAEYSADTPASTANDYLLSNIVAFSQILDKCTPAAIPYPTVFGAEFTAIEAHAVLNFSGSGLPDFWSNHGALPSTPVAFCNVTLTHTHPGKEDTLRTQIWLPLDPEWNSRMLMAGGGGWSAGFEMAAANMYGAVTEGYATSTVDGGIHIEDPFSPASWALSSPGNIDYNALQDFAFNGLIDGALATKSVVKSFYGHASEYSYWNGCSQGGRQGYMFAQRFPDVFDGIAAAAPAINWSPFVFASTFPQQVLFELGLDEFPQPCEYEALRQAAIAACDGNDGLVDGLVSDPDSCSFDPHALVGSTITCRTGSTTKSAVISEAAALAMKAAWQGARTTNGSSLWYPHGYEAEVTIGANILQSTCSDDGHCVPARATFFTHWIQYFVQKIPGYNVNNMTRAEWVRAFHASEREYDSIINTAYPDLSEFRAAGGKLLTYHGLADSVIPYGGTRDYYARVSNFNPNIDIRDFYRYFEAPGAAHCVAGQGGVPTSAFAALVEWVERGIAPETLVTKDVAGREHLLCPYPSKAVFGGNAASYTAEDFVCT